MTHHPKLMNVDLAIPQWVGAAELQTHEQGHIQPWRLPLNMLDFLEDRTRFQAANPSGVRLRFASNTRNVYLTVEPEPKLERWFDLLADGRLAGRVKLDASQTAVHFEQLPAGEKTLELWLNHMYAPVTIVSLEVDADASFASAPKELRKRILFYGSSISHGRKADGPSESWTVGAAHLAELEPINMGLGGACTMEPAVARHLRDQSADYLSFCLGVNVVAGVTHSPRVFRSAVIGLIQTVREKHPHTPLAVQSGIFLDGPLEHTPNVIKMSMQSSREQIAQIVALFKKHGDKKIIYTDGLELLGPADAHLLIDGVHPGGEGHRLMSQRYNDIVWPQLKKLGE